MFWLGHQQDPGKYTTTRQYYFIKDHFYGRKTITSEIAILRVLNNKESQKKMRDGKSGEADATGSLNSVVVYIAPMKALARERMKDWRVRLGEKLKLSVVELTGDVTPDISVLKKADVIITTPEKWDGITRGWRQRDYAKSVALVIIDEIHLLGILILAQSAVLL